MRAYILKNMVYPSGCLIIGITLPSFHSSAFPLTVWGSYPGIPHTVSGEGAWGPPQISVGIWCKTVSCTYNNPANWFCQRVKILNFFCV